MRGVAGDDYTTEIGDFSVDRTLCCSILSSRLEENGKWAWPTAERLHFVFGEDGMQSTRDVGKS